MKWKNHLSSTFVFLWFITLTLYLSQQRRFPYLYDDEYGVLGASAIFSGLDWSAPAGIPFYGFLLSAFSFPLYWLELEPTTLYQSILAINAILVATSAMLALRTIKLLFGSNLEIWQVGAIIAGFSYPAVLHYSSMALGETALLFCFFLITYNLTVLLQTDQTRLFNAISLGIGIGLAQYAHPRGAAFVIASAVILSFALKTKTISQKQFIFTFISSALTILLFSSLKKHLLTTFYGNEDSSASITSFIDSKLATLGTDSLIQFIQVSYGQITYLLSSSFGLLIPGLTILIFITWGNIKSRNIGLALKSNQFINNTNSLLSGFVLLSFITMFAASVMQMISASRADHFFYGRYNEVMLPALIIAAILFLYRLPKKNILQWAFTSFFITLLSVLAIRLYPEGIFQKTTVWSNITSWLVYIHGPWEINPKYILGGTFAAVTVLAISIAISKKLFIIVLIAFFTSTAFYNFDMQHRGADKDWGKFNELANSTGVTISEMQLQVSGSSWTQSLKGEALQFAFKNSNVIFNSKNIRHIDAVLDYKGNVCNIKNTIAYLDNTSFCFVSEGLRQKLDFDFTPLHIQSSRDRPLLPADIDIPEELVSNGIELNTIDRICTLVSQGYYTAWFRYCLPSIDITISQQGLSGDENHKLGLFITDSSGNWLREWRVKFNNRELAHKKVIRITSPVQIPAHINKGQYLLNIAVIDDHGWDWRKVKKIKLVIK